jgi:hypothetical protein
MHTLINDATGLVEQTVDVVGAVVRPRHLDSIPPELPHTLVPDGYTLGPPGGEVGDRWDGAAYHPPLERLKAKLSRQVDADAERVRERTITPGSGQAMTYTEKAAQANAVLDLGAEAVGAMTPEEQIAQFPLLAASVGIEVETLFAAAELVVARQEAWASLGGAIERARLGGKAAIALAQTEGAARQAYEAVTWPT